jgi:hypothetical protein
MDMAGSWRKDATGRLLETGHAEKGAGGYALHIAAYRYLKARCLWSRRQAAGNYVLQSQNLTIMIVSSELVQPMDL